MIQSIHFWLRCFLLSAGFFAFLSTSTTLAEKWGMTRENIERLTNRTINLGVLALGFISGMAAMDVNHFSRVEKLKDVLVVEKHNDSEFTLRYKGADFQAMICPDSTVDWTNGDKLREFNYEQRKGCKTLHGKDLGFLAYVDKNGKRIKFSTEKEEVHEAQR